MRNLALVLCLVLACRKPAEPPPPPPEPAQAEGPSRVKEQEPNDYQRAQQIPSRAVVEGSISAPRDDDWYRVSPGVGQMLALRVELSPIDAWLEVYDRDRNRLVRVHSGGEDKGVIPAVACLEACFVKVSGSVPGPYSLTVLGAPPQAGKELEPNNRAVDANELQPGKPMQGTYLTGDDEDWYKLVLPPPGPGAFLRIEVTPVEGIRTELEVRALADAALLATVGPYVHDLSLHLGSETADAGVANPDAGGADDAGVDASVPAAAPAPAGYYLVLKAHGKRGAPLSPYTLTASVEQGPPDLEQEPNDDPQHATLIESTATGYLAPAGDADWYRVHSEKPAILHAEVTGLARADIELAVYGPPAAPGEKPPLLAKVNEGGPKEGEVLPAVGLPAGDSYILIQAALRNLDGKWIRDGEDRQGPYKLQIALSPDDGTLEREPNNDLETAQTVTVPASIKGYIWPRKDVDLFRFHVPAGQPPVSLRLSAVRGVDLVLRLLEIHGKKSEVIGSSDAFKGEGEEQLVSVPLKEGDYAAEVASPRNKDASATQPYTLTIQ
jgi:hypothetical protein